MGNEFNHPAPVSEVCWRPPGRKQDDTLQTENVGTTQCNTEELLARFTVGWERKLILWEVNLEGWDVTWS